MKGIQTFFKSPLFCFHSNCGTNFAAVAMEIKKGEYKKNDFYHQASLNIVGTNRN
jgi:hypothetical protein